MKVMILLEYIISYHSLKLKVPTNSVNAGTVYFITS